MPTQIPHSQIVVFKTPYNADYMQMPALDRLAFSGMFSRIIALPLKSMIIRFSTRGNPTYDWSLAAIFDALITSADLQPAEIRCKEIQFIDVGETFRRRFGGFESRLEHLRQGTWKLRYEHEETRVSDYRDRPMVYYGDYGDSTWRRRRWRSQHDFVLEMG
jgi:hypothetical protein